MSRIHVDNYEAFLLDFYEGNLSHDLRAELDLFFIQHPELAIELTELPYLPVETIDLSPSEKTNLKKTVSSLVSEHDFISYIEHQLTDAEKTALEKSCEANEDLAKELKLYNHTIYKADASIIYPNKDSLKRKTRIIWFNFSAGTFAAAASIALLVGLFILWPTTSQRESLVAKQAIPSIKATPYPVKKSILNPQFLPTKPGTRSAHIEPVEQPSPGNAAERNIASTNAPPANELEPFLKQDTSGTLASVENVKEPVYVKDEIKLDKYRTIVETIVEPDESMATSTPKKGLWSLAAKALNNLNKVGVKQVDGDEEKTPETQMSYALTLGPLNISHKGN